MIEDISYKQYAILGKQYCNELQGRRRRSIYIYISDLDKYPYTVFMLSEGDNILKTFRTPYIE